MVDILKLNPKSNYWTAVFDNMQLYHSKSKYTGDRSASAGEDDPRFTGEDIEAVPRSLRGNEAVVIKDIAKTFKSLGRKPVHAVNGISLKMYPGEITAILGRGNIKHYVPVPCICRGNINVFLGIQLADLIRFPGHNGAGKTTLFNMLTGMTSVTSGNAEIFG